MKHVAPDYCTIYLYEKDPTTWNVIGDGGAARLKCLPEANYFHFMLHAIKLLPETSYTLIYYPDPWPGAGLICLGSGTTDLSGYLHIKTFGNYANYTPPVSTGNMPKDYDYNFGYGAKIWLVPSADVNCAAQTMTAWNPEQYLFEIYLISFVDSDGE
jgi:hypothetical protein